MEPLLRWALCITAAACSLMGGGSAECPDENLAIDGGDYTLSQSFDEGSVLVYRCPSGFFPYRVSKRTCENGQWSPRPHSRRPSKCREVQCPNPLVMENGEVSPYQRKYFWKNETTYTCYSGYTLRGSHSRVCKDNGKWSGETPICSRDDDHCLDPGIPPGTRRTGHIFNIDDKVTYRCDRPLTLIGSKERVCQEDGQWSGSEPQCYYSYTFDTPVEVAVDFGGSLSDSLAISEYAGMSVTDQVGRRIQLKQGGKLNIYIALDSSDSINEKDFEESKHIIKKLVEKISYYEVNPNYEIIVFATEVHEIVNIVDFYQKREKTLGQMMKDLDAFGYDSKGRYTGTNIAQAFSHILSKIVYVEARDPEGFNDIRHVIIMFTDGMANMGGKPKPKVDQIRSFVSRGQPDREEFVDFYVFGLGEEVLREDVNEYVTQRNDERFFFNLRDMKDLQQALDDLIDESNSANLCGLNWDYEGLKDKVDRNPWVAEITVTRSGPVSSCMGAMVSPRFILTAAHCFKFGDEAEKITVTIEDSPQNKIKKVKRYIPHPLFNPTSKVDQGIPEFYDYDVALVELAKDVSISRSARPICIPCTKGTSGALKLSGHVTCNQHRELLLHNIYEKATFLTETKDGVLNKSVTIKQGDARPNCIEDAKLAKGMTAQNAEDIVTKNFLCTGGIEPTTDYIACKGDSGGALFVNRNDRLIQVGVVSWGVEDLCSRSRRMPKSKSTTRDFHINLFEVLPFLKEHLQEQSYDPLSFLEDV